MQNVYTHTHTHHTHEHTHTHISFTPKPLSLYAYDKTETNAICLQNCITNTCMQNRIVGDDGAWDGVVAHVILVSAQGPNTSFFFFGGTFIWLGGLFGQGLGLGLGPGLDNSVDETNLYSLLWFLQLDNHVHHVTRCYTRKNAFSYVRTHCFDLKSSKRVSKLSLPCDQGSQSIWGSLVF